MPRTVAWHRSVGGSFTGARQFLLDTGLVLGAGVYVGRVRLTVDLVTNLGGDNTGAPTTGSMVMAGVRQGIDSTTAPGVDPRTGPNSVDWWAVEYVDEMMLTRSTVNGWDLTQRTRGTREVAVGRLTTGVSKRVWLICSAVAVPSVGFWAGTAYLEVQYWTP